MSLWYAPTGTLHSCTWGMGRDSGGNGDGGDAVGCGGGGCGGSDGGSGVHGDNAGGALVSVLFPVNFLALDLDLC